MNCTIRTINFIYGGYPMKSKELVRQAFPNEWSSRFADQKTSGLTIREWCEQNNLSFHKCNYWKHQLKEEFLSQTVPDIVPLLLPISSNPIPVQCGSLTIHDSDDLAICANRAIRTNLNEKTSINLSVNGISVYVPENHLSAFVKALFHA